MTQPDLKLRAEVAVEMMGWRELSEGGEGPNCLYGIQVNWGPVPRYELSLDACREVLAEIERRGLTLQLLRKIGSGVKFDDPWKEYEYVAAGLNATAADICRAALAAVREAKETDR